VLLLRFGAQTKASEEARKREAREWGSILACICCELRCAEDEAIHARSEINGLTRELGAAVLRMEAEAERAEAMREGFDSEKAQCAWLSNALADERSASASLTLEVATLRQRFGSLQRGRFAAALETTFEAARVESSVRPPPTLPDSHDPTIPDSRDRAAPSEALSLAHADSSLGDVRARYNSACSPIGDPFVESASVGSRASSSKLLGVLTMK